MQKTMIKLVMFVALIAAFSSCTTINHSMRHPNTLVNLNKSDFTLSEQVTGEATCTKILNIDFERLFTKRTGVVEGGGMGLGASGISLAMIPVIGNFITDKTANYSLFNMMKDNPGYDVVFYPQYETKVLKPVLGIGFITTITTVKTTARLGKLNK
jgi:hypothetical protein